MDQEFNELAGRDDALYRALGLLVRHLHIKGVIDISALLSDMQALAAEIDPAEPQTAQCQQSLRQIAGSFGTERSLWDEARAVHQLFQPGRAQSVQ